MGPHPPTGISARSTSCHLVEREVRTRVPGIPAPVVSLDQKAERGSAMRASRESPTIVIGGEDVDPQTADLDEVTGLDLGERHAPER